MVVVLPSVSIVPAVVVVRGVPMVVVVLLSTVAVVPLAPVVPMLPPVLVTVPPVVVVPPKLVLLSTVAILPMLVVLPIIAAELLENAVDVVVTGAHEHKTRTSMTVLSSKPVGLKYSRWEDALSLIKHPSGQAALLTTSGVPSGKNNPSAALLQSLELCR
jgi:hypothetical protein